jgi:hypothetical protein
MNVMLQPVISVHNLCLNSVTKFCQINSHVPNDRDGCSVFWCREYRVRGVNWVMEVYSPNTLEKTPPNTPGYTSVKQGLMGSLGKTKLFDRRSSGS